MRYKIISFPQAAPSHCGTVIASGSDLEALTTQAESHHIKNAVRRTQVWDSLKMAYARDKDGRDYVWERAA